MTADELRKLGIETINDFRAESHTELKTKLFQKILDIFGSIPQQEKRQSDYQAIFGMHLMLAHHYSDVRLRAEAVQQYLAALGYLYRHEFFSLQSTHREIHDIFTNIHNMSPSSDIHAIANAGGQVFFNFSANTMLSGAKFSFHDYTVERCRTLDALGSKVLSNLCKLIIKHHEANTIPNQTWNAKLKEGEIFAVKQVADLLKITRQSSSLFIQPSQQTVEISKPSARRRR